VVPAVRRTVEGMKLSIPLYATVVLCFLLPFGTVSCGGNDRVSVTGVQLATWSVPGAAQGPDGPNFAQHVEDEGSFPALLALVAALVALALAWTAFIGWRFVAAFSSTLLLLYLPLDAAAELADVHLGAGFVLALSLLLVADVAEVVQLVRRRRGRRRSAPTRAEELDGTPLTELTAP
jgi:hypothetical protein